MILAAGGFRHGAVTVAITKGSQETAQTLNVLLHNHLHMYEDHILLDSFEKLMRRAARSVQASVRELNGAVRLSGPRPFRTLPTGWCFRTGSYSNKVVSRLPTLSTWSSSMAPPLLKLGNAQIWLGSSSKSRRGVSHE